MRVLVTGAGGQLGRAVVAAWQHLGGLIRGATHADLDITDRQAVLHATRNMDVVVNCAAYTDVDGCETDPDRAYAVNALAVRWLRDACRLHAAHLVHISTDYVFGGDSRFSYHEWVRPYPVNVYGHSKLGGEREAGPDATIIRTSWLCGHGENMVTRLLRQLSGPDAIRYVTDQRGCPTFTSDLAPIVAVLGSRRFPGIWHASNSTCVSRHEFACVIAAAAGHDASCVESCHTKDLPHPAARRPVHTCLDNRALRLAGLSPLGGYHDAMCRLVAELEADPSTPEA